MRPQILWFSAAVTWCIMLGIVYMFGTSGTLFYDDIRPLAKLADIDRIFSFEAAEFVLGETSGPLGRQVAMLSFLPHFGGWPETLSTLLQVNVLIHLINGLLVFFLTRQLLAFRPPPVALPAWGVATIAAILWVTLPIHAATVLIPIQRMALLSTTFVLLGLIGYLAGLWMQIRGHNRSTDVQVIAATLGFTLAVLSKENGALLVVLLLVIELTLLGHVTELRRYRWTRVSLLALASLVILAYLARRLINDPIATFPGREFSALERLATQPLVILDYLRQSFLPHWQTINPFQDHWHAIDLTQWWGIPGIAGLTILFWLVTAIATRRYWPWFAFGSLWFFGAQLLESTTLNLELAFLHRAYLPLVGLAIFFAVISSYLLQLSQRTRPLIMLGMIAYIGLLGLTLANVTRNWGEPEQAARVWFEARPASSRATVYLAKQLREKEDTLAALEIIERHLNQCPQCMFSRSWALFFSCQIGNDAKTKEHYKILSEAIPSRMNTGTVAQNIEVYHGALIAQQCNPGPEYTAYALLEQLLKTNDDGGNPAAGRALLFRLGRLYIIDGDVEKGMEIFSRL